MTCNALSQGFARWSPVEQEWVLLVPNRATLPARADVAMDERRVARCPFCPGAPDVPTDYDVAIVDTRYPIVHADAPVAQADHGQHSVFLYTSDHTSRLVEQPTERLIALLEVIGCRTAEMLASPGIEAVFCFETVGDHFGPTVDHPHGQIVGFAFTPRRLAAVSGPCWLCAEAQDDACVVAATASAVLRVPAAARLPFEMVLHPRRHVGTLDEMCAEEIADVAALLACGLRACRVTNGGEMPQYMLTIMQAPRVNRGQHHLRLELVPLHRPGGGMKRPGGVELGAGVFLNPVRPETAARMLANEAHQ